MFPAIDFPELRRCIEAQPAFYRFAAEAETGKEGGRRPGEAEEEGELLVGSAPIMTSSTSSLGTEYMCHFVDDELPVPLPELDF